MGAKNISACGGRDGPIPYHGCLRHLCKALDIMQHIQTHAGDAECCAHTAREAQRAHRTYSSSWATLQQCSSSKMVVEPLLLNHNEYALSLLEELGRSNVRNAEHVAIIQNAVIYYRCLVTKRQFGTIFAECWPAAVGTSCNGV